MLIRFSAVPILLVLLADARGDGDPASVARAFFDAWAAGDVERAVGGWKEEAGERFRMQAVRTAAARCFVVRDAGVRVVHVDATRARVELDADVMTWNAGPDPVPAPRTLLKSIDLERDGDAWRIAAFGDREEAAADAIAAGGDSAAGLRTPHLAGLLTRRAITMVNRSQFGEARRLLRIASEIAAETGDGAAEAEVMSATSVLLLRDIPLDLEEALRFAERAAMWAEAAGDTDVLARACHRLGRARSTLLGELQPEAYERAVALTDRIENVTTLAHAHSQLAAGCDDRGDHRAALRHSLLTAKYAEEGGDIAARINAALNLAGAFFSQSDHELARDYYVRASELAREAGFHGVRAFALQREALVALLMNREEEFLAKTAESLAVVAVAEGTPYGNDETLAVRAGYFLKKGDFAAAKADLEAIAALGHQPVLRIRNQISVLWSEWLRRQNRCEEALQMIRRVCDSPNDTSCRPMFEEASVLDCLGRKDEAFALVVRIVDDEEGDRLGVSAEASQLGAYQEGQAGHYEAVAVRLVERGHARQALAIAERMKARILTDARHKQLATAERLNGDERAAYERLDARIATLNRAILAASMRGEPVARLREELGTVRLALRELLAGTDAALAAAPVRTTVALKDERVPAPPPGILAIEYLLLETQIVGFAVTRGSDGEASIVMKTTPITRDDLRARIDRYLAAIEQRDVRAGDHARELHALLLAPFDEELRHSRVVCIIPAADLWRVPFHALRAAGGRYVVETASLFYAPSLRALDATPSPSRDGAATLLALANPNLRAKTKELYRSFWRGPGLGAIPETEREVRALGAIYGRKNSRIYVGDAAQESVVKREAPHFRVLHIAAHGILDEQAPMFSALALSSSDAGEDGLLEAREIADLQLGADLAVLSACDTGRGRISRGEGIIGMSWALLAAGCPTAVVSQWRADSATTAELMIAFHRDLVRTKRRSPVASLRRAQLALMRRNPHPYYWAPFIVVGRGH